MQLFLPLSRFKNLLWNDFIVFFGMKNTPETKNAQLSKYMLVLLMLV